MIYSLFTRLLAFLEYHDVFLVSDAVTVIRLDFTFCFDVCRRLADEIFAHLVETGIPAVCRKRNLGRGFIPHGAPAALLAAAGLDADSLTKLMQEELSR